MKSFLLLFVSMVAIHACRAQNGQVNTLPRGTYETVIRGNQNKWDRGDIILIDETRYRISSSNETGEYRFSATAQRVFFTSGPLKNLFAKTSMNNNTPAIVLPVAENQQQGMRLPADVWGLFRQ
jgi:hypothetical protein